MVTYNHMVVGKLTDERADRVFHALADTTRRDIVVRTLEGEHSVSALARRYPMSFAAVQKHVAVLEEAGLVTKRRKGREQHVRGNVDTVRRAWQLWADPRQLERWWGPPGYPATFVDHDLTVGSRATYYMTSPEGEKHSG